MDFLLFTLSCFIGFNTEFACEQKAMPRANNTYLECVMRGKERVEELNDFLYANQYGDQIVTVCLEWDLEKSVSSEYIPETLTASQIEQHTKMSLITYN